MAKYQIFKHYRGTPEYVDFVPMDQWTPAEVDAHVQYMNDFADRLRESGEFVDSEAQTYGGQVVVNPSGGLISKGHPLGATGLAQCAELNWQIRGEADQRQVDGAKVALQHNLGLGGAAVVALYRKR